MTDHEHYLLSTLAAAEDAERVACLAYERAALARQRARQDLAAIRAKLRAELKRIEGA